ncbi:MAG TPA: transaldolase family protein, partial [Planctomycetota bacterium]|nr:transaldolase family protein [Planctomycetota bacterium]
MNPLKQLTQHGQSVWFDNITRNLVASGGLAKLIADDGLRGMTSNPAIFEKAIGGSGEYDAQLRELARRPGIDAGAIFEALAIRDIQAAADVFRPVYLETSRGD